MTWTCCLKTSPQKRMTDRNMRGLRLHVPSKCQPVQSALMEELCLKKLNIAFSGAHITQITNTNTHSCINEKMTVESHRPSVLHCICSDWITECMAALFFYIPRSKLFMICTLQTPDLHTETISGLLFLFYLCLFYFFHISFSFILPLHLAS